MKNGSTQCKPRTRPPQVHMRIQLQLKSSAEFNQYAIKSSIVAVKMLRRVKTIMERFALFPTTEISPAAFCLLVLPVFFGWRFT